MRQNDVKRPGAAQRQDGADARLQEAELRFQHAFDHAPIGMAVVALDGGFMKVNHALCEIVGHDAERLVTKSFQDITHPEDLLADLEFVRQTLAGDRRTYRMEKRYIHSRGHIVWVMLSVSLVRDGDDQPLYFISQIEDITERKELEERLRYLASHDEMTGLLNRRRFDEELGARVAYAQRYRHPGALLMLDLDNFKGINDSLGHHVGDELVKGVALRLLMRLRETDLLGRLGGDEFGIFLPEVELAVAEEFAHRLLEHVAADPFIVGEQPLWTRASVGVAAFNPKHPVDAPTLLMAADAAMYEAKRAGGDRAATAADPHPSALLPR
jgi:diguanylate cyclase (GGDEF)-like protein/PAS domain S-box-containing protein